MVLSVPWGSAKGMRFGWIPSQGQLCRLFFPRCILVFYKVVSYFFWLNNSCLGEAKGNGTHHYILLGAEEGTHSACRCAVQYHGGVVHLLHLFASFWSLPWVAC